MGNSEVGHMAIGAGAPIDTDLVCINKAIATGTFAHIPAFETLFAHVRAHHSTLHVKGLLSPGGIHSHSDHLYAFLRAAKAAGVARVALHVFLDGRDTPPQSAAGYLEELEHMLDMLDIGTIATASGRFYAMDRDHNWDRVGKAAEAIFAGRSPHTVVNARASAVVRALYEHGALDEHIEPIVFFDGTRTGFPVEDHDGIFFFNFRADRARMLAQRTIEHAAARDLCFVTLTTYDESFACDVAFPPFRPETTLAAEVSRAGLSQVHIAETEKYAHVTYFLNGGREEPYPGETHVLIESHKDVPTHDLAPEMRAREIADEAVRRIEDGVDFIFINYANADMVGHTANVPALHAALNAVDSALGRVVDALLARGGFAFITADHGNAEENVDTATGVKHTAHTTNLVPAILTIPGLALRSSGTLPDVAPTMLTLMGLTVPPTMTGVALASPPDAAV